MQKLVIQNTVILFCLTFTEKSDFMNKFFTKIVTKCEQIMPTIVYNFQAKKHIEVERLLKMKIKLENKVHNITVVRFEKIETLYF